MDQKRWLFSWVGETDHRCAENPDTGDLGPIASAITRLPRFDRIILLTNYPHERTLRFSEWLEEKTGCVSTDLYDIALTSPIDYADIYRKVSEQLRLAGLPKDGVEATFHLSPGTPAMTAVWIILAKTRYPAALIQTSKEQGLQHVDFDFDLANDFLPEFLKRSSDRIERLSDSSVTDDPNFAAIIHASPVVSRQLNLARRVAVHDVPVLVLGETGTGKELFAKAIHDSSGRSGQFVAVNCGAIPKDLINSELFGHKKGSFTGAVADHKGYFAVADGGTLFLDEIGDLPLDAQVRLLRALQQKEISPVGASAPVRVNVRIIAATHRDLARCVAEGTFREDLFHRLAVGILNLPPLRDRGEDVGLLLDHFLAKINADAEGKPEWQRKEISAAARNILLAHAWPGNVRELYHTLLRAAIWSHGATIEVEDVKSALLVPAANSEGVLGRSLAGGLDLQGLLDDVARHYLERALAHTGGVKKRAAEILGFPNHQTFSNWQKRLGGQDLDQQD